MMAKQVNTYKSNLDLHLESMRQFLLEDVFDDTNFTIDNNFPGSSLISPKEDSLNYLAEFWNDVHVEEVASTDDSSSEAVSFQVDNAARDCHAQLPLRGWVVVQGSEAEAVGEVRGGD